MGETVVGPSSLVVGQMPGALRDRLIVSGIDRRATHPSPRTTTYKPRVAFWKPAYRTLTVTEAVLLGSSSEVTVTVPVPTPVAVNMPVSSICPMVGVAVQVTPCVEFVIPALNC